MIHGAAEARTPVVASSPVHCARGRVGVVPVLVKVQAAVGVRVQMCVRSVEPGATQPPHHGRPAQSRRATSRRSAAKVLDVDQPRHAVPNANPARPSSTELATWPIPQAMVTSIVLRSVQPPARDRAIKRQEMIGPGQRMNKADESGGEDQGFERLFGSNQNSSRETSDSYQPLAPNGAGLLPQMNSSGRRHPATSGRAVFQNWRIC